MRFVHLLLAVIVFAVAPISIDRALYPTWSSAEAGFTRKAVKGAVVTSAGRAVVRKEVFGSQRLAARIVERRGALAAKFKNLRLERQAKGTVSISMSRFGAAAKHIQDAQRMGHKSVLTLDRGKVFADLRRKEAMKGTPIKKGFDRDEYPPAMFKEGGKGASVRHIDPKSNRACGKFVGSQCAGYSIGDKIRLKIVE